eukprot:2830968-Amphidinium_carterae.1
MSHAAIKVHNAVGDMLSKRLVNRLVEDTRNAEHIAKANSVTQTKEAVAAALRRFGMDELAIKVTERGPKRRGSHSRDRKEREEKKTEDSSSSGQHLQTNAAPAHPAAATPMATLHPSAMPFMVLPQAYAAPQPAPTQQVLSSEHFTHLSW